MPELALIDGSTYSFLGAAIALQRADLAKSELVMKLHRQFIERRDIDFTGQHLDGCRNGTREIIVQARRKSLASCQF